MSDETRETDNLIEFPTPPARLLRVLIEQAQSAEEAARIALRILARTEYTRTGERCPWCQLDR